MNEQTPASVDRAATDDDASTPRRRIVLAGATGLVGRALLGRLLDDPTVAFVHTLGRRAPAVRHPRLVSHQVDFSNLPALPPLDEAYLALGTTIKVAGSQAAFRAIDFDASLAVATAARRAGARRLGLVSAMGADARSRVFYSRVKGELEQAVAALGFEGVVIARPSLLLGDREALGQPPRPLERLGLWADRWIGPILPANYRGIRADDVARALALRVPASKGLEVMPSGRLRAAA